jgi:hypothetical protein
MSVLGNGPARGPIAFEAWPPGRLRLTLSALADLAAEPGAAAAVADNIGLIARVTVGGVDLDMDRPEHLALRRLALADGGQR